MTGGAAGSGGVAGSGGAGGGGGNTLCTEPDPIAPACLLGPGQAVCKCSDEAAILLPMLANAAQSAFITGGDLCWSAISVPATVPAAKYYVPCSQFATDFHTGDVDTGWICLGISMPETIHCRYTYTKGSSPVTVAHGGPNGVNGAESFEVAAEGDQNGDGITSAFTITGQVNAGGQLVISPMFADKPQE